MTGPDRTGSASRLREYKVQPPRPPNAWILYRSYKFGEIRQNHERVSQAAVSKIISDMWKNESEHVKRHFERMADDKKAEHQQLYPDYRFSPQRKEDKVRAKEDRKQSRRAKKSKARDATPTETDADADADATVTVTVPPPMPYMPQQYFVPGYQPNMAPPQPYVFPYLPEARYGPAGPSPPISAAPSPAPYESSESPEAQPYPEENVPSSSSSPSSRPSPNSESRGSSSSLQLPPNSMYLSPLPSSHHPSPNPYATQPLPTLLFQSSAPSELPLAPPQVQFQSTENTVTPAAPVFPSQMSGLNPQNSQEVVNFDIPVSQTQNFTQFSQNLHAGLSLESFSRMFEDGDDNGAFDMSNVDESDLLAQPQGDLDVTMGPQAPTLDYNKDFFRDFDFAELERQMASFAESGSSSAAVAPPLVEEDLQALFRTPDNPEVQAYTTARQRQPSAFTQDMMHFFDFEAAEGSAEDTSSTIPPAPAPVSTTVAPQQVRIQSTHHAAEMPIFTQMTNTPTDAPSTSYVPPAGAIYSSMRRVAASWKSSFPIPPSQVEDPVQSWTISTN